EDDALVCEVVELALADEGYDVCSAHDGVSALDVMQQRSPDLLLLDLTLPGGRSEAYVVPHRAGCNGAVPILLMSGRADIGEQDPILGADGAVEKRFDIDVLVETVRAQLASPHCRIPVDMDVKAPAPTC